MTITEFLILHEELEQHIAATRETPEAASHLSPHLHSKLTTAEQLLVWLCHTHGETIQALKTLFEVEADSTLYRTIDHVTCCINTVYEHLIDWPSAGDRQLLRGWLAVSSNAIAILDGVHCEIQKPTHGGKAFWSVYKGRYSQFYLVAVSALGMVVYIDGPHPGRGNDRGAFNKCTLATNPEQFVSEGECILADGGFCGGHPLLCPVPLDMIAREEDAEVRMRLVQFNDELSEGRRLVEDVFSWLKGRARIFGMRFPRNYTKQGNLFYACCRVYNCIRGRRIQFANRN
jgi:hypothetical protein